MTTETITASTESEIRFLVRCCVRANMTRAGVVSTARADFGHSAARDAIVVDEFMRFTSSFERTRAF